MRDISKLTFEYIKADLIFEEPHLVFPNGVHMYAVYAEGSKKNSPCIVYRTHPKETWKVRFHSENIPWYNEVEYDTYKLTVTEAMEILMPMYKFLYPKRFEEFKYSKGPFRG